MTKFRLKKKVENLVKGILVISLIMLMLDTNDLGLFLSIKVIGCTLMLGCTKVLYKYTNFFKEN